MAATVRVGKVAFASSAADSRGTGRSAILHGAVVRVAGVTFQSVQQTPAVVRIAGVSFASGQSTAVIRVADIAFASPATQLVWDGTQWVPIPPPGVALSVARGRSSVTGTTSSTSTAASVASGRSQVTGTLAFSGTLALAGGGVLQPSGAQTGPQDFVGNLNLTGAGALTLTGSALVGPPGAGSLTVIPDPTNRPPRVLLELTGALGTQVTINRVDAAGTRTPVRLANPATLNGGSAVVYDYECPFLQTVRYEAITSGPTITSDPIVLNVAQSWLIHPGIPSLSMPIKAKPPQTRTRSARQGVFEVIGRTTPLTRTDSPRRAPTFNLVVKTFGQDEAQALETLLADNSVLLLQIANPGRTRTDYWWASIGDVTEDDITDGYPEDPYEWWTLPITVTDAPSGLLQAQRTWRDVLGEFSTWRDLLNAYATWRDVITDNRVDD